MVSIVSDEELREIARKTAKEKVGFYTHFTIYIAVNALLIAIWWATGGPGVFPWFIFALFGWGIGIAAHYIESFKGRAYEERLAEKEYQKLKETKK